MANELNKQSYFIKRLRDSGYIVDRLDIEYGYADPRFWTVIIDPGCASVFCTCFRNLSSDGVGASELGDSYFELHDGGQFLPSKFKIKTNSMEIIVSFLNQFGIVNKARGYNDDKRVPQPE